MRKRSDFDLIEQQGGKYALVMGVTRRARQLNDGAKPLIPAPVLNIVATAIEEVARGRLRIVPPEAPRRESPLRRMPIAPIASVLRAEARAEALTRRRRDLDDDLLDEDVLDEDLEDIDDEPEEEEDLHAVAARLVGRDEDEDDDVDEDEEEEDESTTAAVDEELEDVGGRPLLSDDDDDDDDDADDDADADEDDETGDDVTDDLGDDGTDEDD